MSNSTTTTKRPALKAVGTKPAPKKVAEAVTLPAPNVSSTMKKSLSASMHVIIESTASRNKAFSSMVAQCATKDAAHKAVYFLFNDDNAAEFWSTSGAKRCRSSLRSTMAVFPTLTKAKQKTVLGLITERGIRNTPNLITGLELIDKDSFADLKKLKIADDMPLLDNASKFALPDVIDKDGKQVRKASLSAPSEPTLPSEVVISTKALNACIKLLQGGKVSAKVSEAVEVELLKTRTEFKATTEKAKLRHTKWVAEHSENAADKAKAQAVLDNYQADKDAAKAKKEADKSAKKAAAKALNSKAKHDKKVQAARKALDEAMAELEAEAA